MTNELKIQSLGDGEYRIDVASLDGSTSVTLVFGDANDTSGGQLTNDEKTARATLLYLLDHQDATDLPERLEIGDVLVAYPDATEKIMDLRE